MEAARSLKHYRETAVFRLNDRRIFISYIMLSHACFPPRTEIPLQRCPSPSISFFAYQSSFASLLGYKNRNQTSSSSSSSSLRTEEARREWQSARIRGVNEGNTLQFPRGKPSGHRVHGESRASTDDASRIDQTDIGGWKLKSWTNAATKKNRQDFQSACYSCYSRSELQEIILRIETESTRNILCLFFE